MWRAAGAALLLSCMAPGAANAQPETPASFIAVLEQAEARGAAQDWAAAVPLWERVVRANPTEGRFWNALATARYQLRDFRAAIPAYEQAVALGFGAPANNAYNIAAAHALLGEEDRAFAWLERALQMRFLDLELALRDPDLAALRSDPRFRQLIPIAADVSRLSRVEGWRHDLAFLLWQIDRLGVDPYRRRPRSWFVQRFEALAASAESRSDTQLAMQLMPIMRELGDGHSGVMRGEGEDWGLTLPLQFHAFEEGVFIVAADPRHRGLLGAQLISYGGRPVEELMSALAETVSRDNEGPWTRLQASYRLRHAALLHAAGWVPERDSALLRVRGADGRVREVRVAADLSQPDIWNQKPHPPQWLSYSASLPGPEPFYLQHAGRAYWFEHLPAERTVFFGLNRLRDVGDETLAAFSRRLAAFIDSNEVDRLIVDLRWNNGGNSRLIGPVLAAISGNERINRRGRLFVLIGRRTFSAAQNAAALFERFTAATFVGEPTGSSPNFVGEEDPFTLPYSRVMVNVSHLAWQSGWAQDRRTWIAPLLYVAPTFAAYRAKRDPALEAILAAPIP